MALQINGINNLINKLNNLSSIETKKIVEEVAEDVKKSIITKASSFSDTGYMHIDTCDVRNYKSSCFIDVGLKGDNAPFDLWKNLWFHQWGYFNKGLNFGENGPYLSMHRLWFDEAVKESEAEVKKKLKDKLKQEVRRAMEG